MSTRSSRISTPCAWTARPNDDARHGLRGSAGWGVALRPCEETATSVAIMGADGARHVGARGFARAVALGIRDRCIWPGRRRRGLVRRQADQAADRLFPDRLR